MIAEEYQIASPQTRAQLWANLLRLETLGEWSAVGRCLSTDTDVLAQAQSRTASAMAVVNERVVLEPDGRGTLVRYTAAATSSMFGPAVTVWLHDHVALVQERLTRFVQRTDTHAADES